MAHRVCPWWIGYFLINPLRHWRQDPRRILAPHVHPGMIVLEPGPGMGFFTLELARLVGPSGRVIAADIQPKMLDKLKRRAATCGLSERIEARLAGADSMPLSDLGGQVDFALAFAVVHEMPAAASFFRQAAEAMKTDALLLFVEPRGHVKEPQFEAELRAAAGAGFAIAGEPRIAGSHTALLRRK